MTDSEAKDIILDFFRNNPDGVNAVRGAYFTMIKEKFGDNQVYYNSFLQKIIQDGYLTQPSPMLLTDKGRLFPGYVNTDKIERDKTIKENELRTKKDVQFIELTKSSIRWSKAAFWGAVIVGVSGIIVAILIANGYLIFPK